MGTQAGQSSVINFPLLSSTRGCVTVVVSETRMPTCVKTFLDACLREVTKKEGVCPVGCLTTYEPYHYHKGNKWSNLVAKSVNLELRIGPCGTLVKPTTAHSQAGKASCRLIGAGVAVAYFGTGRPPSELGIPETASASVAISIIIACLVIWNGTDSETVSLTFVVRFRSLVAMHLNALVALFALLAAVDANDRHVRLAKRQATTSSPATSASSPSSSSGSPTTTTSGSGSGSGSATTTTTTGTASPVPTTPVGTTIPPLSQITSGMATPSTLPVTATYPAGATPPIPGAPTLPTPCKFSSFIPFPISPPQSSLLQVSGPLRTRSLPPVRLHPPCAARPVDLFSLFRRFRGCLVDDGTGWL